MRSFPQTVERTEFFYYILSVTYFMAGLGLFAVTLVDSMHAGFVAVAGAAVLASLILNLRRKRFLTGTVWNMIALSVFAVFAFEHLTVGGDITASASKFLTVLLAVKLFDLKSMRDYTAAFAIVFFQILAAASVTQSAAFLPLLTLFIIGAIFAMIVFNIRRDFNRQKGAEPAPHGVFNLSFFVSVILLSVFTLAMTFTLFFAIPRTGVGFLERKGLSAIEVSGFSDTVTLGSMGPVKKDRTIVMRVEMSRPEDNLYLRGSALEDYDGGAWRRKKEKTPVRKEGDGFFHMGRPRGALIEQNILLEPLSTDVIFGAPRVVKVSSSYPTLWTDGAGSLVLPSPPYARVRYTVFSDPSPLNDPPGAAQTDLSMLSPAFSSRIKDLSADIASKASGEMKKLRAIERYLMENHSYTLSPEKKGGENPIEDFLFYSREGYCEHYATSFVMLARAAGVPARLVTGFLPGEWNSLGNYFIVRQSDAHSWAEAYVEGRGWVTVDPTPPAGGSLKKPSQLFLYADYLRLRWNRYIVNYTFTDQKRFAVGVEKAARGFLGPGRKELFNPSRLARGIKPFVLPVGIAVLSIVLWTMRQKKRAGTEKTPVFYTEMLKVLEKKGFVRKDSETPAEFAGRVSREEAALVTGAFQKVRYGGEDLDGDELRRVKESIESLKKKG